ncbi:MAG TPA: DUF3500 domain-containing protein [Bryobacteraceae bacterium]|nr:DUF3500 domain-containing protein [Bryobacteraceae bacterium]
MRTRVWTIVSFLCLLAVAYNRAESQQQAVSQAERFQQMSRDAETRGLAEPFKGVTTNGSVQPGLYTIRSTGVSTGPVRDAATAFLSALSPEQRKKTVFPVDDVEWRKWMNQDFYVRQGTGFIDMSDVQRDAAFGLMRASLSAKGLKLSRDIMKLNHTLGELNNNDLVRYGEWRYWITVMGEPSKDKPWGWQMDGHHLIINYFVLGDQVVMSPVFVGSEPVIATSGKYKGTAILQEEQSQGLKMVQSLDEAQKKQALLSNTKPGNNNLAEAFKDNLVLDYAGVRASAFTAAQKERLLGLIALYAGNMDEGHAKVKMDEVRRHLAETYFAWIGGVEDDSVYYYRIHSPVILIEFDHQLPVGLRHLAANPKAPNHEHIHVVVRTPNGNDYGKDLLRQHYAQVRH